MTIATLKYPNGYFGEYMPVEVFLKPVGSHFAVMMKNEKLGVYCRFPLLWNVANEREAIWHLRNDSRITSKVRSVQVTP